VLVALLIAATIREPERGRLDAERPASVSLAQTLRFIVRQPALLHALAAATVYTLWSWGLMWWTPSYLVRSHHMTVGAAGGALSLMHGIGGTAVLLLTTVVMGRFAKHDARWVPWYMAASILIATIPSVIAYVAASRDLALSMLWIFIPLSYAPFGPTFALMQNLVPASMRAQTVAIMLLTANVANLVVAPQAVGLASDLMAPSYGADSLRHALVPLAFVGFWAAWHYLLCAKHLRSGLQRAGNSILPEAVA
jgi:hypothetical protein